MRDASGQMYMRNRYYDPATGQFTQTDPIGLAGGMNAYGFAAGDPVTYGDPYGLCKVELQYTPAGGVGLHTTLITTSPDGSRRFWSGGAGHDRNQLSGGSAGSAGSSVESSSGEGGQNLNSSSPHGGTDSNENGGSFYGNLRVRRGTLRSNSRENQPDAPRTVVRDDRASCDQVNSAFDAAAARIENAQIAYNPFIRNSNSAAHYLLQSAGISAPKYSWRVVGWSASPFQAHEWPPAVNLAVGLGAH
ncbi:RHS repeat-associated core domain-containing protein [Longimicrobium sp.]|uniref:RHS repeat-associated core domain-containing protein n=1 Tax=Longimicrobium sp. TaxID=2029185 RepID=UPI0039C9CE6C